jgi:hypothetical protein
LEDDGSEAVVTPGRKRLIVNADDLGRTVGINDGIFEAHARGLVSSATLMVAYPAAVDASRRLADHPRLGIGLHVALTGGRPLLAPERIPSLVDADGRLASKPEGIAAPCPDEVRSEIEAQLGRFRALVGRAPTHLDSHHHSHRLPVVREALIAVALAEDLPVRNASPAVERRLREAGVATTDHFIDRFYGDEVRLNVLLEILERLPPGVTEVMCHPGRVDDELCAGSSYVDERANELELLTHPDALAAVAAGGIEPIDFGAL